MGSTIQSALNRRSTSSRVNMALSFCVIEIFQKKKGLRLEALIFSAILQSRCCSSRSTPNRGGIKVGHRFAHWHDKRTEQRRRCDRRRQTPSSTAAARTRRAILWLEHVPGSVVACASEDDGRAPDHSSRGDRGFADSPLERRRFELSVPPPCQDVGGLALLRSA